MLTPGTLVAGKYRIERLLGAGGMGAVYVATNLALEKPVALKVMGAGFLSNPDWVQRFFREGIAASKVRHPGVVQVFDAGEQDGAPWMAMELLEGESLRDRLARTGCMHVGALLPIVRQVLGALAAVHAVGIVHRDLKPDNIFLEHTAEGERAKVLDFGIAKEAQSITSLTATGTIIGTAHYLAPEQARDSRTVDARTDLYAFGVILFECLSGQMPYDAQTVPELIAKMYTEPPRSLALLAPHVPPSAVRVVHACLAREPSARPQSAKALLEALGAAEHPGAATGPHVWSQPSPPASTLPMTNGGMPSGHPQTGPVSTPPIVWGAQATAPLATPASTPHASGTPRARPVWPWILGGLVVMVLGGMGLLVAVVMFGAYAAATQVASNAANSGGGLGAFDMTIWDSPRAPMIADANGDGREDLIGSVLQIDGSGNTSTSFAAYEGATGRQLFRTESIGSPDDRTHSRCAVAGDTLVYANASGQLYGYELRTGRPRWNATLGERTARFCQGDAGAVIVETADERRSRVSLTDGSSRPASSEACVEVTSDELPSFTAGQTWTSWEHLREDVDIEGMRVSESFRDPATGRVLALGQRRQGTAIPMVALVEPNGGGWRQDVPGVSPLSAEADEPAAVAITETHVFLAYTMNGDAPARVTSIALAGGQRAWDVELGASHFDPRAIVAGAEILAVLQGGKLLVLDRRTGAERFAIGR